MPTNIVPPISPLPTTAEIIKNPRAGLPDWVCLHVDYIGDRWSSRSDPCQFRAKLGSSEQVKHAESAHVRKLTPEEEAQVELNRTRAAVIFPTTITCAKCLRDDLRPGESHMCAGRPNADQVLPHDAALSRARREDLQRALDELAKP